MDWKDTEAFNRQDYYLAQIAAEIERQHVKKGNKVTIEKKMLKFTSSKSEHPSTDEAAKIQTSKNFWLGLTGISSKKRKKKRK